MQICALIDDIALVKVNSHTLLELLFLEPRLIWQMNFKEVVKKEIKVLHTLRLLGKDTFL